MFVANFWQRRAPVFVTMPHFEQFMPPDLFLPFRPKSLDWGLVCVRQSSLLKSKTNGYLSGSRGSAVAVTGR